MKWKYKACSVLLFFFTITCSLIATAQVGVMKKSAELRESFDAIKTTARWVNMKPEEQMVLEKKTQERISSLEAEEASIDQQSVEPQTTYGEPAGPNSLGTQHPTKALYDNFQLLKQTSLWANMSPEERAEETKQSLDAYRKFQEMEGTAETPDVKQIESQGMKSFRETDIKYDLFMYATIFAIVFLGIRFFSSKIFVEKDEGDVRSSQKNQYQERVAMTARNEDCNNKIYALAFAELENDNLDTGLWAKCFAEAEGDENRAKAKYISARVEILTTEQRASGLISEGVEQAKRELGGFDRLDRVLWNKVWDESRFITDIAEESYIRIRADEYARTKAKHADAPATRGEEIEVDRRDRKSIFRKHPVIFVVIFMAAIMLCLSVRVLNKSINFISDDGRRIGAIVKPKLDKYESMWSKQRDLLLFGSNGQKRDWVKISMLEEQHEAAFADFEKREIERQEREDFWRMIIDVAMLTISVLFGYKISELAQMGLVGTCLSLILFPFGWAYLAYRANNSDFAIPDASSAKN